MQRHQYGLYFGKEVYGAWDELDAIVIIYAVKICVFSTFYNMKHNKTLLP